MADKKKDKTANTKGFEKETEEKLANKPVHVHNVITGKDKTLLEKLRGEYKEFISECKTEREAAADLVARAQKEGFSKSSSSTKNKSFYCLYKGKVAGFAKLGNQSVENGVNMVISHLDSPRLDFKQNPIYQSCNLALAKTHYYGGIKKYQWVTIPLAIHGFVVTGKGDTLKITVGEDPKDPVFTVLDLLPHLGKKAQYTKKLPDIVTGEKLNIVIGGTPFSDNPRYKQHFKLAILELLNKKYGIVEQDLVTSEIYVVPAGPARDVGFDGSLIGGYGHDDRVSAFTSVKALFDSGTGEKAQAVVCVDREEIGSQGATSATGRFVLDFIGDMLELEGKSSERAIRRALSNSKILSADVNAAINPDWQEVHDRLNAAYIGHGIVLTKYTGSGGKGNASEASAEFMGEVRNLFNQCGVIWQAAGMGKVDEGGGGTVAKFLAKYGADVLDSGVAVLSMHSPFEIIHVGDLYMSYKGYKAFLEKI